MKTHAGIKKEYACSKIFRSSHWQSMLSLTVAKHSVVAKISRTRPQRCQQGIKTETLSSRPHCKTETELNEIKCTRVSRPRSRDDSTENMTACMQKTASFSTSFDETQTCFVSTNNSLTRLSRASFNQSINNRLIHKMTQRILTHNATTYSKT